MDSGEAGASPFLFAENKIIMNLGSFHCICPSKTYLNDFSIIQPDSFPKGQTRTGLEISGRLTGLRRLLL